MFTINKVWLLLFFIALNGVVLTVKGNEENEIPPFNEGVSSCQNLSALAHFIGYWQHEQNNRKVTEFWSQVSKHTFEGKGVFYAKGSTSIEQSVEALRLVKMLDGIYYLAKPTSNELPIAFKLTQCTNGRFVFINKQHDFPQKLVYQFISPERLNVAVTDLTGNGFDLQFSKEKGSNSK